MKKGFGEASGEIQGTQPGLSPEFYDAYLCERRFGVNSEEFGPISPTEGALSNRWTDLGGR